MPERSGAVAPRWLNEEEGRLWRALLTLSVRLSPVLEADLGRLADLSFGEYEVLHLLSQADGHRIRMSELATLGLVSRSRLTYTVDRLEERGLVERGRCDSDRRGVWAVLTGPGHDLLVATAPGHVESVRAHLLDHVEPAEVAAAVVVLERLADALRDPREPGETREPRESTGALESTASAPG